MSSISLEASVSPTHSVPTGPWGLRLAGWLAAGAGYALLAELGSWMPIHDLGDRVFLLWPATGMALAIVVRGGMGYLIPLVLAAGLWQGWGTAFGWPFAAERAASVAVSVGVSAWVIRRFLHREYALETIRDVFIFVVAGPMGGGALLATLTAASICLGVPDIPWSEYGRLFTPWWLAEAVGILVVSPFFLVWSSRTKINWSNRQLLEVAIWIGVLLFVGAMVFGNWAPTDTLRYPLELALFPILCWAAIRFGQRGATAGIVIVGIMAVWELLQVLGPEQKYISTRPEFIWVFVGVLSATAFFLAAIITEVRRREERAAANERHLQAFIDALPDAAFVVSAEGCYLEVYAPQRATLPLDEDVWRGSSLRERWPEAEARRFEEAIGQVLAEGVPQSLEYRQSAAGRDYWFEGRLAPMAGDGPEVGRVIWLAYEITGRKRAQEALELRDRALQGVAEATTALLSSDVFEDGIRRALALIGRFTAVDFTCLMATPANAQSAEGQSEDHWSWALDSDMLCHADWNEWPTQWIFRLRGGEIVMARAKDEAAPLPASVCQRGVSAVLLAPVFAENRFWGVLALADSRDRQWEDTELASLRVAAGSLGGFVQNKRGEERLRQAKEAADRANTAKGEFLAMMSHEIRTPMNAVLGYTDLLAQTDVNDRQREWLEIVNRSGKALLELINNILDYSKIESRGVELEYQPFDLEQSVMEALELMLVKANQKGITLDYRITGAPAGQFLGDAHRWRQILLNLVNNAVKFTDQGGVEVELEIVPTGETGRCQVEAKVRDTGVGIPAEKIDRLFQPFSQVDSSTTRRFGGTGLGLVISKRLIEKMGGAIRVTSEEGHGTCFCFHVFLNRAPEPQDTRSERGEAGEGTLGVNAPLRLLVVEDEPVNQRLTRDILERLGYDCDIAESEEEVVRLVDAGRHYDCVLMDIQLPGKSGLELTGDFRAGRFGERHRDAHIIALTAFALPGDRKRCLDAGANDYLSKPLVIEELKDSLYLAHRRVSLG